ncbi:MAG: dihydroorotase [Candidatus Heimdallarchaeota archaeon]
MYRVVIQDGIIVTDGKQFKADILIEDEKIVAVGENLQLEAKIDRLINANGLFVLPGGIDPHVHLSLPDYVPEKYRWSDDFESGSKAALVGGITSLGCISVPDKNETLRGIIERETKSIEKQAIADFFIHPVLFTPTEEKLKEIPQLAKEGCSTIKIFMVTEDFDKNFDEYKQAMKIAGENNMLTMIHCEDYQLIEDTCKMLIDEGKGSLLHYADSRPIESEVIATQKAVDICEEIKASIYVVHLSSEEALKVCEAAQAKDLPVYVEGRPLFFYLNREEYLKPDGAIYVVQPPLRNKSDNQALWKGLQNGSIQTFATDHAPHTRELKLDPDLNIKDLLPGLNELQLMLPMLMAEGVNSGKISIEQFAAVSSTNTAKLFGLYPRKGTIQVDSDADLVLWDPKDVRKIKGEDMHSKAGFTIYEGKEFAGWPVMTIRRGEVVSVFGQIIGKPGSGQVIPRTQSQRIS